jgi:pimeloyl-[acyl-carrier protein] synthase
MTSMAVAVDDRLFTAEFLADPYPIYDLLRANDPVHFHEGQRRWLLTRYEDVDAVLREPQWSAERWPQLIARRTETMQEELRPLYAVLTKQFLFLDPPDHSRLRGLVNKAFTPRVVERMRSRIEALVAGLLDAVAARGEMDVIRDFAYPLPATVILEIIGLPPEMRDDFKAWSVDFASVLGNVHLDPEVDRRAQRSILTALGAFSTVVSGLHEKPGDDLLSGLAQAEEQGDRLTIEELLANTMLLLLGGHETTTNLIGNGLLALLRHPAELQRLRDGPALIATAVEEFLRYDSPIQLTGRAALTDLELGGKRIQKGQLATVFIGAANRDPERFSAPSRLDLGRKDNRHLSFGYGIHFCLGAPLGRLEGEIAIGEVLRRFPELRLASDKIEWQPNYTFRGLKALPVSW